MSDLTPIARLETKIDMMLKSMAEMKDDIKSSSKDVSDHKSELGLLKQAHENCPALAAYNLGQQQKPAKSGNTWTAIAVFISFASLLTVIFIAQ